MLVQEKVGRMKILANTYVLVLAALTVLVALTPGCHPVQKATTANLCGTTDIVFSSALHRVASGSVSDVSSAVHSLSCLDGGNLEDAHIAIGEAVFSFPKKIAPVLESANVSPNDLIAVAVMLSSEYVDEPCKSRDELVKRRISISQDPVFIFARVPVLQELNSAIAEQDRLCQGER